MTIPPITLYVHETCSKSAAACTHVDHLVAETGVAVAIRNYLAEPMSADELLGLVSAVDADPARLVRSWDDRDPASVSTDDVVRHLVQHPDDMQRPILQVGDRAIIARPPELVIEALQSVVDTAPTSGPNDTPARSDD